MTAPVNILFIHQNFPAQYKHLAPKLAAEGHRVVGLGRKKNVKLDGVTVFNYRYLRRPSATIHPFAKEHEVKLIRGEAVAAACNQLKAKGFTPAVVYVHPAWGEALFLREVYPDARIIVYCEYYYSLEGQDVNFDPEFPKMTFNEECQLRMKNTCYLHALQIGDEFTCPTRWQRSTYPQEYRERIRVIHDGFDFAALLPDPAATLEIPERELTLTRRDKVITYLARNLEPMRGFHTFMRLLPGIQKSEPDAHIVVVGADGVSYGRRHESGECWRQVLLTELDGKLDLEHIHFLGTVNYARYLQVLNVSRAHLYLSYPFVLSWSFLEALILGVKVVATNLGPTRELKELFENLQLVESGREQIVKAVVQSVRGKPGEGTPAGHAARELLTLERCLEAHMSLVS